MNSDGHILRKQLPSLRAPSTLRQGRGPCLSLLTVLRWTERFRVLDDGGQPIAGLFAVGEVCGQPCLQVLGYGDVIAKGVLG